MEQKQGSVSPFSNKARNSYVLDHITDATLKLLRKRPLEEISISEIVSEAGVGRTSFYRNFETKEDIIVRKLEQMHRAWLENEANGKTGNAELYGSLFQHIKSNADFYLLLRDRGLLHLLANTLLQQLQPSPDETNIWAYTKAFVAYGTYGWIVEWMERGMQESAEAMSELLSSHGIE